MTSFEYLSVLLSIILGLAITQVLANYRGLLLARDRVRPDWTLLVWSALVLLFAMQAWWASFGLEDVRDWRFDTFAVIMLQMALIYVLAALVLPDVAPVDAVDLPAHYEAQRRPFFACLLALLVTSVVKDVMLDGALPEPVNLGFHLALAAVAIAGFARGGERAKRIVVALAGIWFAAYVGLLFTRLDR